MYCTNCGREIDNDAIYCNYCGSKIETVEVEEEVKEKGIIYNIIKDPKILLTLCAIGLVTSLGNIFKFYTVGKDINYIFGQIIFGSAFIISIILIWRSKKMGGVILISFILFKMISSIYYYTKTSYGYFIKNLIYDEIFYLAIIYLLIINWKTLK